MTLKQLIYVMLAATLICWLVWGMTISQMNPAEDGAVALSLFYFSLFFALLGTFFLGSFSWRKKFSKFALDYKIVAISFRQSFFFALMVIGILMLQSTNLLTWWSIILVVAALVILEGFFLSIRRPIK